MNYILTNFLNSGGMQFFLIMITFALSLGAQTWVQNRYQKYRKVLSNSQLSGYEVAQRILNRHGINYITVQENPRGGVLSDHFNPQTNVVNLSKEVYYGKTIASASIAAHEIGHVLQYHEQYGFIGLRNRVLPLAMISSQLGWTVLMIGLFSGLDSLFLIGIVLIGIIGLFQLITLPVEINASTRAIKELQEQQMVTSSEVAAARGMLNAAAFTYIAAFLGTLATILRLFLMRGSRRD